MNQNELKDTLKYVDRKHTYTTYIDGVRVWNALIVTNKGEKKYFKSRRGRVFFERKCDLINALNYAFGYSCGVMYSEFVKHIIIEERVI